MKKLSLLAFAAAFAATPVLADEVTSHHDDAPAASTTSVEKHVSDDGCASKTVHKENDAGDSTTVHKTNCD